MPRAAVLLGVMQPTAARAVAITSAACAAALYLLSRRARKKAEVGNLDAFLKDEGDDELTKVAFTSRWVAAERAMESSRPDALFSDPYAVHLGGATGVAFSSKMKSIMPWPEFHITWMAIRTRYIDERLSKFCAAHDSSFQCVILGSGLDARAFRIPQLATARAVYEVDVPEVVGAFNRAMARLEATAVCPRVALALDLSTPDALTRALRAGGFDKALPTFWLLEGLTMYLTPDVNSSMLEQIDALSAPGSHICAGFIADTASLPKNVIPPFTPAISEYTALLRAHGWGGQLLAERFGDPGLNFGRYPVQLTPDASQCFVIAQRP